MIQSYQDAQSKGIPDPRDLEESMSDLVKKGRGVGLEPTMRKNWNLPLDRSKNPPSKEVLDMIRKSQQGQRITQEMPPNTGRIDSFGEDQERRKMLRDHYMESLRRAQEAMLDPNLTDNARAYNGALMEYYENKLEGSKAVVPMPKWNDYQAPTPPQIGQGVSPELVAAVIAALQGQGMNQTPRTGQRIPPRPGAMRPMPAMPPRAMPAPRINTAPSTLPFQQVPMRLAPAQGVPPQVKLL